jgi:AraC-like DNA-binding protein
MKLSIFNIHDVALFITISLCLLLALFQFFYPNNNRTAKYFLTAFLFDIAIGVGSVLMFWQPAIQISPIIDSCIIPYILFGSLLLKGPLLYGYVSSVTTPDYRLEPADFIHLAPIVIYFFSLSITSGSAESIHMHLQDNDKLTKSLILYDWHSVKIIPIIYAIITVHKVHQYKKQGNDQHPYFLSNGRNWLDILAWGALFNWAWSLGAHILGLYVSASVADKFGILDNYITSALISTLFVCSLMHINKQLSANLNSHELLNSNTESRILEKIIHCMEVEKLFLNPRLNIQRMADHIKTPYREVSALINTHFHANFNEFINLYRINEAKRLLSDSHLLNVPINEIYAQAGFNSKSAFHRFFSRLVGVSPTEFRKLSAIDEKASTSIKTPAAA